MLNIDYTRDELLSPAGRTIVMDRYSVDGEQSPQDCFARAASAFAEDDEHAQRIYDYASKRWFMFSSPILSNGGTKRGLPISCFLNYVDDSRTSIFNHWTENGWLASSGGGLGGYWGKVRTIDESTSSGSKSNGAIPFMKVCDSLMAAVSQGVTRRGAYAAYLDIHHPEIEEFIVMRKPTGGDINRKCLNLHHGINITDEFMEAVVNSDLFALRSPKTGAVIKQVDARHLFQSIIETRLETGEPYLHFIDESNRKLPAWQKARGLEIHQSNLCSEIILPTNTERTAVCCLSSVNLEFFNEWRKDLRFIYDIVLFLDNVLEYFIKETESRPGMRRARYSAQQERSIGLGAMGFHSFLQRMNIPFEGAMAKVWNREIFNHIKTEAESATYTIGSMKGNAPDVNGDMTRRNSHLIAIAPNATSGIICNTSPSIEPFPTNSFIQKTDSGTFVMRNKYLDSRIRNIYPDSEAEEIWGDIAANDGSIQELDYFDQETKDVFKTAFEIDQRWVVDLASDRQEYIDQSQSVNLFFSPTAHKGYLTEVHMRAWKQKMKTLYYVRSKPIKSGERAKWEPDSSDCLSCEG